MDNCLKQCDQIGLVVKGHLETNFLSKVALIYAAYEVNLSYF